MNNEEKEQLVSNKENSSMLEMPKQKNEIEMPKQNIENEKPLENLDDKVSKVKSKEEEEKSNNRARTLYVTFAIIALILVSIAYAALAINLGIEVNTFKEITDLNWNIEFANIKVREGSVAPIQAAIIDESKTGISYSVNLKRPGDYYAFIVDIQNTGSVNAKIEEIINQGITSDQQSYLDYIIKYQDSSIPTQGDVLKAGETKTLSIEVSFKEDLNASDLPSSYQDLSLSYQIIYVEN